ncbi:PadR family transcriptional regulator (plasmid) [Halarchaeum sp. CBA1220]|uniref:PadR family transcriptional regulator n=1 Tax=Halarchaeum sp. CBA1220 TaxID=1853682 RepID=UPI000F3A9620|nr:PadR family transcriptional regulator [Halarchaeum sp. CBA1220]QLC35591.1 PadR family transcriptional regulator [Halarchaeum sp. CBA1220]
MSTDLGTAEGTESRELVRFVTQQTRFAPINNILQHPEKLPSMYELKELNPRVSDATAYKHIQKLIDAGVVKEVALDGNQRRQGYPWKFYGLSEEGRELLAEHNLLAAEEPLQQIYDTLSDKPEKMVKYENAPRPNKNEHPNRK